MRQDFGQSEWHAEVREKYLPIYAAAALQGLLATYGGAAAAPDYAAKRAFEFAEAMLERHISAIPPANQPQK